MIQLFTSPSCTSCRKARAWLQEHHIDYTERNMMNEPLSVDELKMILTMTENGSEDLLATRSKAYAECKVDFDELTVKELLAFLSENPALIRRPLLLDDRRLQIGYNEDEIRCFLPREIRRLELRKAQAMAGLI